MFLSHKIDDYIATRSFRKTPYCNTDHAIYLSEDGFRCESDVEHTTLKWLAFSRAVIFSDGVLLYRGGKMVNWIPDASLTSDDGASLIRTLLAAKLPISHSR